MIFMILAVVAVAVIIFRLNPVKRARVITFVRVLSVRISLIIWAFIFAVVSRLEWLVALFHTKIFQMLGQLPSDGDFVEAQNDAWLDELIMGARKAGATGINVVVNHDEAVVMHIIDGKLILAVEASYGALLDLAIHIGWCAPYLRDPHSNAGWLSGIEVIDSRVTKDGFDQLLTFSDVHVD